MAPSSKGGLDVPHDVSTVVQSTLAKVAELSQQLRVSPWCHFWTGVLTVGTAGQGSSCLLCWGALHPGTPKPSRIGPAEVTPACATTGGDRGAERGGRRSITFGVGPTSMVPECGSEHIPHLPWEHSRDVVVAQWREQSPRVARGGAGCCFRGLLAAISPSKANMSPKDKLGRGSEESTSIHPAAELFSFWPSSGG